MHQREKGEPQGPGEEGKLLPPSGRGGYHVPDPGRAITCHTGLLSSPPTPTPAPSLRPAEGAGTTYSPKTRCPGRKQIRASEHGRRGADGAPRRCQVQKRISGTQ